MTEWRTLGPLAARRTVTPRARALLRWFRRYRRPLPWRVGRDPYRIWVSEVLLQQTRVAQAIPYFERFVRRFPDVRSLARARSATVLKIWQGAGYYDRARRLHAAARLIVSQHEGHLPSTSRELRALPGFGPYIAAAVASLAFGEPVPALEANGNRVLARWGLVRGELTTRSAHRRLDSLARAELPAGSAGEFNEAVMELGETICTPRAPRCSHCPVSRWCRARQTLADPGAIPHARRRPPRSEVHAALAVIEHRGRWLVQRRPPGGLLGGLWEFPGGKLRQGELPVDAARRELREETGLDYRDLRPVGSVRHSYSHFTVRLEVFGGRVERRAAGLRLGPTRRWATRAEMERLPLPKATLKVLALLPAPGSRATGAGASPG